ncbi:MAG: phage tail protein [Planctomycetaceae bacterium]|nr:phage tail protein [Planctomycetaceae bacterium]
MIEVPANILVPFTYVAFDGSGAIQGAAAKPYKALLVGQKLSSGTAPAGQVLQVVSPTQAASMFGAGSLLHSQAVAHFRHNTGTTPVYAYAFADDGAWTAGGRQITVTGTATAAGTIHLYVAGDYIPVTVASGATATTVAVAIREAINAKVGLPFTAAGSASPITVTARNAGVWSLGAKIVLNYNPDQQTPAGLTIGAGDITGAAGFPTLDPLFAAMGEIQYDMIALPWRESGLLTALRLELESRWGPLRQNDGMAFLASPSAYATVLTEGQSLNSGHFNYFSSLGSPHGAWQWSAAVAGVAAQYTPIDQARPHQGLELIGLLPAQGGSQYDLFEQNALLGAGVSPYRRDANGAARITRLVTTYKTNAAGDADIAYRDVTSVFTLSYLRWDFKRHMEAKFARSKLAGDNANIGPASGAIVTPKIAKAEAVALFQAWERLGLVQDVEAFKAGLTVQIDPQEPTRLNFLMTPMLVNSLVVKAATIQFSLN